MDNNPLIPSTKLSPDQRFPIALPIPRYDKRNSCSTLANRRKKQVCLYNWYLIRVDRDHPDTNSIGNGKLVALEGYTTSDLNDHNKFRTAPIETRIGKLKLKTVDGMDIFLKSMIDEQRSFENGFPFLDIPLTPTPRVRTTAEEVSKAFGLKTSRSGRLLVPPLAHWCNQTIAYDMDGGIIAILDASSHRDKNNGSSIFTPPNQKDALSIRKKLCDAANESNLNLTSSKKTCRE